MPGDPLSRPLIEIARELRDRRTTARELVDAAIARHESVGERLHAYSFWAPEQARAVEDGLAVALELAPAVRTDPEAADVYANLRQHWESVRATVFPSFAASPH